VTIQFHGAVRTVTGSMHVITIGERKVLLDCGLFQGRRKEAEEKNRNLPFNPREIAAMILSHAHIDHSGNIPSLVKQGFEGNIFATFATRDLCSIMLLDSAHIQEKDAEYVNKRHRKKGLMPVEPLYTKEDVVDALQHFVGHSYNRWFFVTNGVKAKFVEAGHILGSAQVILEAEEAGLHNRIVFTGDLGRPKLPILRDPAHVKEADYLIIESTYGGRYHDPIDQANQKLAEVINRTAQRGGKIIVPAFSVGRTQELVYSLHQLRKEGRIPALPVYVDSPLSTNVTEIFRVHSDLFDRETYELFLREHEDPFGFGMLEYIRDVERSKALNDKREPCIIISASGMCEAGRILHHLKNNIGDPRNTILIVGYMAHNTLGRKLVEKWEKVRIFGEEYVRKAEVVVLNTFSAHADRNDLLEYVDHFDRQRMKGIFCVHGDEDQTYALVEGIKSLGFDHVVAPERGDTFDLA